VGGDLPEERGLEGGAEGASPLDTKVFPFGVLWCCRALRKASLRSSQQNGRLKVGRPTDLQATGLLA